MRGGSARTVAWILCKQSAGVTNRQRNYDFCVLNWFCQLRFLAQRGSSHTAFWRFVFVFVYVCAYKQVNTKCVHHRIQKEDILHHSTTHINILTQTQVTLEMCLYTIVYALEYIVWYSLHTNICHIHMFVLWPNFAQFGCMFWCVKTYYDNRCVRIYSHTRTHTSENA